MDIKYWFQTVETGETEHELMRTVSLTLDSLTVILVLDADWTIRMKYLDEPHNKT